MTQSLNCLDGIQAGIDQIFGKCANNPVAACVNLANLFFMLARGFNDPSSGSIDNGGDPAGLSVKAVLCCHVSPLIIRILVNPCQYSCPIFAISTGTLPP